MKGDSLPQKVLGQLEQLQCIQPSMTVCCALSGGADSVCLLRCLLELQQRLKIHVTAVHVNHCLRGEESKRDQTFCETLCTELEVPLTVYVVNVSKRAESAHISVELAARECRYEAMEQLRADWIATAHTASDNLETLIHRLTRGGSLHGLTAIPVTNGHYLRPLLDVTRTEVEQYLEQLKQPYVTDSTNLSDVYTRNRIRHFIVPELKHLNPSVERTVSYTLRSLRREDDFLKQQTQTAYAKCHTDANTLTQLGELHPALQMRCMAMLLDEHHIPYDAPLLERLGEQLKNGGKWELNRKVVAIAENGTLSLQKKESAPCLLHPEIALQMGENRLYAGYVMKAVIFENENFEKFGYVHEKFANSCLDYDKIKGNIVLRPRQYGERVRLPARPFTSSLKKLIQSAVPAQRRATLHTLADSEGMVFAEYIGAVDRVRVDETTHRLLILEVVEEQTE